MSDPRSDWQRHVGVGERQSRHHEVAGTDDVRPVIADDGPFRGQPVGQQVHKWDDRVDAKVQRAVTYVNPALVARKVNPHGEG